MKCDTCKRESAIVLRVVIAKGYNRALARPIFNCPACFEQKAHSKERSGLGAAPATQHGGSASDCGGGSGQVPRAPSPEPRAKEERA